MLITDLFISAVKPEWPRINSSRKRSLPSANLRYQKISCRLSATCNSVVLVYDVVDIFDSCFQPSCRTLGITHVAETERQAIFRIVSPHHPPTRTATVLAEASGAGAVYEFSSESHIVPIIQQPIIPCCIPIVPVTHREKLSMVR